METAVLIEKTIESCNCEHVIKLFIESTHFTHEMLVDFDLCDNNCGLVEILIGATLYMCMLLTMLTKKLNCFRIMVGETTKNFC